MTILNSNKPVWFNKDGGILANGYIWVGEENKASNNFEVTVTFEDSAGTLTTAEQPLRTDDSGRIVYLGTPIIATVAVTHSLLILNSAGKQVDYIPSVEAGVVAGTTVTETYNTEADAVADTSLIPGTHVVTLSQTTLFSGGGADWVVITFSGTPGDGDLILDLDNGAQLKKLFNQLNTDRNLGEIATAGAAAQLEARDNIGIVIPSDIADTAKIITKYIKDHGDSNFLDYNTAGAYAGVKSIGKTGSGANYIWTALDGLPSNVTALYVSTSVKVESTGAGSANEIALAGGTVSLGGAEDYIDQLWIKAVGTSDSILGTSTADIPLNSSGLFFITGSHGGLSNTSNSFIRVYLRGYSVA